MNKRICVLIMILALVLSGCQLAKPEAQAEAGNDMLVGVFVTAEHLDLFDMEAYLQDHIGDITNGQLNVEESAQYSGRIWAEFQEDVTDGITTGQYVFPDLEGIFLASYRVAPHGENENAYWNSEVTEGLCDVHTGHYSTDEGFDLEMSGTIYLSETYHDPTFFFNPVYQTPDGQVYLVSGQGTGFSGGLLGGSATHTISEEGSVAENGETQRYSTRISVTMEIVSPARNMVILQMDENSQLLKRMELDPHEDFEDLVPEKGCAYILVEEHTSQGVRRSLYQKEDRNIIFFRETESHICLKVHKGISWSE